MDRLPPVLAVKPDYQISKRGGRQREWLSPIVREEVVAEVVAGEHGAEEHLIGRVGGRRSDVVGRIDIAPAVWSQSKVIQVLPCSHVNPPDAAFRPALQERSHDPGNEDKVLWCTDREVRGVQPPGGLAVLVESLLAEVRADVSLISGIRGHSEPLLGGGAKELVNRRG